MTRSEMSLALAAVVAGAVSVLLFFSSPAAAATGSPELLMPDFSHLEAKATESVDVSIDGFVLRIARKIAANEARDADPQERAALDLLNEINSIQVRNFEFADEGAYSKEDIADVRRQLTGPNWNAIVQKRRRDGTEDVDVFLNTDGNRILGIAVIASQPRSFTIVNISGNVDVDKLSKLGGKFDIPHLSMAD